MIICKVQPTFLVTPKPTSLALNKGLCNRSITLESSDSVHEHLHASLWSKISEEVKWLLNLDKWDTESANVGSGMILPSTSCSMQWELNLIKKDWIALCVTDLRLKRSWNWVLKTSDALPSLPPSLNTALSSSLDWNDECSVESNLLLKLINWESLELVHIGSHLLILIHIP